MTSVCSGCALGPLEALLQRFTASCFQLFTSFLWSCSCTQDIFKPQYNDFYLQVTHEQLLKQMKPGPEKSFRLEPVEASRHVLLTESKTLALDGHCCPLWSVCTTASEPQGSSSSPHTHHLGALCGSFVCF